VCGALSVGEIASLPFPHRLRAFPLNSGKKHGLPKPLAADRKNNNRDFAVLLGKACAIGKLPVIKISGAADKTSSCHDRGFRLVVIGKRTSH
jgi:hypothetical protein